MLIQMNNKILMLKQNYSSTFLLDAESDKKYRQDMINSIVRLTIIFLNGLREDLI